MTKLLTGGGNNIAAVVEVVLVVGHKGASSERIAKIRSRLQILVGHSQNCTLFFTELCEAFFGEFENLIDVIFYTLCLSESA